MAKSLEEETIFVPSFLYEEFKFVLSLAAGLLILVSASLVDDIISGSRLIVICGRFSLGKLMAILGKLILGRDIANFGKLNLGRLNANLGRVIVGNLILARKSLVPVNKEARIYLTSPKKAMREFEKDSKKEEKLVEKKSGMTDNLSRSFLNSVASISLLIMAFFSRSGMEILPAPSSDFFWPSVNNWLIFSWVKRFKSKETESLLFPALSREETKTVYLPKSKSLEVSKV